jgi:hypothetical protein
MKITTCLLLRRISIPTILFLLSTSALMPQIKIKERVEIAPKAKISKRVISNSTPSTTIPLLFNMPGNPATVMTTRPCHINASGSVNSKWASGNAGCDWAVLLIYGEIGTSYDLYGVWATPLPLHTSNTPASFNVGGCSQVNPVAVFGCSLGDGYGLPGEDVIGDAANFGDPEYATALSLPRLYRNMNSTLLV